MSHAFKYGNRPRRRRGFTLFEATVAAVVMSALLVLLGQAVGWVALAQRQADRRQMALLEASNVLEQVTALAFDAIDVESAKSIGLSADGRALLGAEALHVDVEADTATPPAKRIVIEVRYGDQTPEAAVRLTTWVYERGDL
ncbi:MAG: type II secretion system protein [Pirellulales bacterium]